MKQVSRIAWFAAGGKAFTLIIAAVLIVVGAYAGVALAVGPTSLIDDTHPSGIGSFGSGSDDDNIPGWEEGSGIDSASIAKSPSEGNNDSASPNDGRFAKLGWDEEQSEENEDYDGEWMCVEVDASGYRDLSLAYYWRGDADAESSDDGIVEYSDDYDSCGDADWNSLQEHDLSLNENWNTQEALSLPEDLDDETFLLRFRNASSDDVEHFRVDGVLLTGDEIGEGVISGYKFNHEEEGLEGWTIWLFNGDEWTSTETDGDGYYEFEELTDGEYTVCEESADGWQQNYPAEGEASGLCEDEYGTRGYDVSVIDEEEEEGYNFVNVKVIELYGYKWHDYDRDGEWYTEEDGEDEESYEPGVEGWSIFATPITEEGGEEDTESEHTAKSAVTEEDGAYEFEFTALEEGWWRISEENRDGWTQTYPGGSTELEEDPYYFDVYIEAEDGEDDCEGPGFCEDGYYDYNFGNWRWPVIEISKWRDENENSEFDEGETSVGQYPIAVGRIQNTEPGEEEGQQIIDVEIIAMDLTGSNGTVSLPIDPAWFPDGVISTEIEQLQLMGFEGALSDWGKTFPNVPHGDQVNISFRDGLEAQSLHTDSFFDIFAELETPWQPTQQGYIHGTEEGSTLRFGNMSLLPECSDGVDNDGDGMTDYPADNGCGGPDDNDEPPAGDANQINGSSSSGGGGGGGNGPIVNSGGSAPSTSGAGQVLGVSTEAEEPPPEDGGTQMGNGGGDGNGGGGETVNQCESYITASMAPGRANDPEQVKRLQEILSAEGFNVALSGEYDDATFEAVKAFQLKYADEILAPWGITNPTGTVYLTTKKKLNEIRAGGACPLTEGEQAVIDTYKNNHSGSPGGTGTNTGAPGTGDEPSTSGSEENEVENITDEGTTTTEESDGGFWDGVKGFLGF